jgi:hypothetical protein
VALRAKIVSYEGHPIDEDLSMGTPEAEDAGFGDSKARTIAK